VSLHCADGQRGEFGRDGKPCAICGKSAMWHFTVIPEKKGEPQTQLEFVDADTTGSTPTKKAKEKR
jgi:hypothetical protein